MIALLQKLSEGMASSGDKQQILSALDTDETNIKQWLGDIYVQDLSDPDVELSKEKSNTIFEKIQEGKIQPPAVEQSKKNKLISFQDLRVRQVARSLFNCYNRPRLPDYQIEYLKKYRLRLLASYLKH